MWPPAPRLLASSLTHFTTHTCPLPFSFLTPPPQSALLHPSHLLLGPAPRCIVLGARPFGRDAHSGQLGPYSAEKTDEHRARKMSQGKARSLCPRKREMRIMSGPGRVHKEGGTGHFIQEGFLRWDSELGLRQRLRMPGSLSESDREWGEVAVVWTRSRGGLGTFCLED